MSPAAMHMLDFDGVIHTPLSPVCRPAEIEYLRVLSAEAAVPDVETHQLPDHLLEHTARVVDLAGKLANCFCVDTQAKQDLLSAARLHEAGMLAVPQELLMSQHWLNEPVLEQIRAQAKISAEIACATENQRTVWLIEEQYTDYVELRRQISDDSEDLLLAGILRVADAYDAVTFPRPYQSSLTRQQRFYGLLLGQGTKYDPEVIDMLWELGMTFPLE